MYDIKIANGYIVDGTGSPGRVGDVGISQGRVAAVFDANAPAGCTIDATGLVVAPGVVDVHTHLDLQVMWDPTLGVSPEHGVTSAVMGNCGFSVAPTHRRDREMLLRTLENVEGMDFACMTQALGDEWGFESFPEYLSAVDARDKLINLAAFVGHTPLRHYVMGPDAVERTATSEEISAMRRVVAEALDAGAIGFSTSGSPTHIGAGGKPIASRLADFEEILALAQVLDGRDTGIFMCTLGPQLFFRELRRIAETIDRPVTFAGILADLGGVGKHRDLLRRTEELRADGLNVVAQVSCRPLLLEFNLREPFMLTNGAPGMMRVAVLDELFAPVYSAASVEEKMAVYRDEGFARRLVQMTDAQEWHERLWAHTSVLASQRHPDYEQLPITVLAQKLGSHPAQVVLDLSVESGLADRFVMGFLNQDPNEVQVLLSHPDTQVGLSDAGAHVDMLCDANFPTYLLGRWVRERQAIPLEEAVAMLTDRPARLFGLRDRGRLAPSMAADVFIFDPAEIDTADPKRVFDLPGGASRLTAESRGVHYLMVNGTVVREPKGWIDLPPGGYPGRVLRHGVASR